MSPGLWINVLHGFVFCDWYLRSNFSRNNFPKEKKMTKIWKSLNLQSPQLLYRKIQRKRKKKETPRKRKILEKILRIRKRLGRKNSKSHLRMTPKNLKKTQKKVVTHQKKMK